MKIKILPIKSDNVDLFIKTFNESLSEFEGEFEFNKYDAVCHNQEIYIDNQLIGFIGYQLWKNGDKINQALCNFFLFKEYRNKGYGSIVIEEIIRKNKTKYDTIYCMVSTKNTRAFNFYKRNGCFVSKNNFYINDVVPGEMMIHQDNSYIVVFWEYNKRVRAKQT